MKVRAPVVVGAVVGVAAALLVIGYVPLGRHAPKPPMLSDYGGPVRGVVLQYVQGSDFVAPVFRQYLQWQSADVTAYIACPAQADFDEVCRLIGPVRCKLTPVFTGHEQTAWSRDRWVALLPSGGPDAPVQLLCPKGELGGDAWLPRAGDSHIAEDLARLVPRQFQVRRSALYFDGGDFLADGADVFATRALLERNLQHTVTTRENLLTAIADDLHLAPIPLDQGPAHHAGMFMMCAGPDAQARRVMVVADPSLGRPLYQASAENDAAFTGGPDFSPPMQHQFDAVAEACANAGYRVVRIPVVPAAQGKMYITYVNVILDRTPAGKPVVYMSTFGGQEKLNDAGAAVWESLGYEVRRIDCTGVWQLGGTLHCLVNVYRRE